MALLCSVSFNIFLFQRKVLDLFDRWHLTAKRVPQYLGAVTCSHATSADIFPVQEAEKSPSTNGFIEEQKMNDNMSIN